MSEIWKQYGMKIVNRTALSFEQRGAEVLESD